MACETGSVPNSGCVPSQREMSQFLMSASRIVAGGASTMSIAVCALAAPTPYSSPTAFQYAFGPILPAKSLSCVSKLVPGKNTCTMTGFASTGPPRLCTCGNAGCDAGNVTAGLPPSPAAGGVGFVPSSPAGGGVLSAAESLDDPPHAAMAERPHKASV